jgi:hypothetical protein
MKVFPASASVTNDPIDAVSKYAVRFHQALGSGHVAASPLGAYLLLAAAAPAAGGATREELERVLGCPVDVARRFLADLLADPHPAISGGFAIWDRVQVPTPAFKSWRGSLPSGVHSGPVPEQEAANQWVNQETRGLITDFPVLIHPLSAILLASALATNARWKKPFLDVPATELGATPWASDVSRVLMDASGDGAIVWTESAGLVGALISRGTDGLTVFSVLADPTAAPATVVAAAHEIAAWACERPTGAVPHSLFDLPLGLGHAWEIVESEVDTGVNGERVEVVRAFLPAWEAHSPATDLMANPAFGFQAAGDAMRELLDPMERGDAPQAAQSTMARFDRDGFSAASASALDVPGLGFTLPRGRGVKRVATIRFSRPFAVVAVTESPHPWPQRWHGVPVFSAWVTKPSEFEPRTYSDFLKGLLRGREHRADLPSPEKPGSAS